MQVWKSVLPRAGHSTFRATSTRGRSRTGDGGNTTYRCTHLRMTAFQLSHGRQWKHYLVQPEARYWFCDRFSGHFLGFHLHGGQYNAGYLKNSINFLGSDLSKLSDQRYQGWFTGAGVAYGYAFILGRHWNLELEAGFGYAYTRYDVYRCGGCGKKIADDRSHHYFGPTKAAINLVYAF